MIKLEDVTVIYNNKTLGIKDINLEIKKGEFVGIIGPSGGGKSTLLKTINLLVKPVKGKVYIDGREITNLDTSSLRKVRRQIGFVFQDYNLVERSSVLANVLLGRLGYMSSLQSFFNLYKDSDYYLALQGIKEVGLEDKIFARADRLSGGQKQRVAIAKALCQQPGIILADEPVSNLDLKVGENIMNYFKKINEKQKITIVINLHDVNLALKYCHRIVALSKGQVLFDKKTGEVDEQLVQKVYL
ncbi:phosphonate transport system ATP-binding protein [Anaerobranca californiensis DSM 14826]|jgi:phosphonate transport system ATP-binding protein|uniref:Phosphonate transport system ATP-binding protein n=1 Tax=Anaerobranca californiensis DSM 14826 TaxID=1120989 RepID=A0A1M6MLC7_9FIRM|nr:phosphonate ABC transporter ATP-binding protein [Anaerobranca californiensis]SHJ84259.1 phosphonate transport system ATP-binding protein [Anaerobranca californiensis DSM 14826]